MEGLSFTCLELDFERIKKNYVKKTNDLPLGDLIAFIPAVESTPLGGGLFILTAAATTNYKSFQREKRSVEETKIRIG